VSLGDVAYRAARRALSHQIRPESSIVLRHRGSPPAAMVALPSPRSTTPRSGRLRALCSNRETRDSGKVLELDHLLHELIESNGHKVILWSHYVATIEALLERYGRYGAVALYGGTEASERQVVAGRFQNDDRTRLLICSPAAAGTGFTLTAATYTIYETLSWRYDFYAQSQDRNHRIGQKLPVTYVRLLAAFTVEDAIAHALERKSTLARTLLGDRDEMPRIADLTREELCALLMTDR
jgi:SNF2 family DNA or RNA helicase